MTGWQFGTTPVSRWKPRRLLSLALRVAIFALPLVAALAVDLAWIGTIPAPEGPTPTLLWVLSIAVLSTIVVLLARWVARRFLPLSVLYNMSLPFPDASPSRLKLARRRPRGIDLEREVNRAYVLGETEERSERAEVVLVLALALSNHDARSRAHSERVRLLAEMLSEEMQMVRDDRERLRWAAVLHDVGKLTIAPGILNKRTQPDDQEWEILRQHPESGARLVRAMMPWLGEELGRAVEHHHERYDGSGYPHGLEGEQISRIGRVLAVVDSFEVMTAARPYHLPMTVGAARAELARGAGTQFDPAVVRAFAKIPTFRLFDAIGAASLIALVPLLRRLPVRLGRMFAPVANVAVAIVTAMLVLLVVEGAGSIHLGRAQPARLLEPVALSAPGTFSRYFGPFRTSHTVATIPTGVLGLIQDRSHLYISGYAGAIDRFSLAGGSEAVAQAHGDVGADSSLVQQGGRYYFAARGTGGTTPGIYTFDPSTLKRGPMLVPFGSPLGMAADPQGDSLFVVATGGLYRVDDPRGQPRIHLVVAGSFDGVTVSSDGSRLYVPSGESILGFDRSGNQVLNVDVCCHNPDGLVILGDGAKLGNRDVSGNIFVNDNDGSILVIDTYHGNRVAVVASGGLRGDFMITGIDGCLYATQGPAMVRMEPCFTAPGG